MRPVGEKWLGQLRSLRSPQSTGAQELVDEAAKTVNPSVQDVKIRKIGVVIVGAGMCLISKEARFLFLALLRLQLYQGHAHYHPNNSVEGREDELSVLCTRSL